MHWILTLSYPGRPNYPHRLFSILTTGSTFGSVTLRGLTLTGGNGMGAVNSGSGGAIYNTGGLRLTNSFVAGNTALTGPDIWNLDIGPNPLCTRIGANIVQFVTNSGTVIQSGPLAITAAPLLAPLGNYGGRTQTMALFPGGSGSRFTATPVRNGANLEITVPTALGRTYTLLQSDTLVGGSWVAAPGFTPQSGTGSPITFQIPGAVERKFYQVQVSLP